MQEFFENLKKLWRFIVKHAMITVCLTATHFYDLGGILRRIAKQNEKGEMERLYGEEEDLLYAPGTAINGKL